MDTLVDNSYRGSRSQDGNYADMWPRPSKSAETKSLGQVSRVGDVQPATALASSHLVSFSISWIIIIELRYSTRA